MSAHFAGSIGSADRRRRRMAQESQLELSPAIKERAVRAPRKSEATIEEETAPVGRRRRLTLIPHAWWLIGVLSFANILTWGCLIWTGTAQWSENAGLQELANLKSGATVRYFSVLQLLLTAQLSLLIYWYRSMSRKDFMGRYRIWGWAGLFWAAVCLATATDTSFSDVRSLLTRINLDAWRPDVTCWLLPLSIGVVAIYRVLRREVRQSRPSLIAWEISFALGILAASLHLGLDSFIPKSARFAVTTAVGTLWQVSLVISCLIHARFVVHISNESPPRQPSRGTIALRWANRKINRVGERILATQLPIRLKRRLIGEQNETAETPQPDSTGRKKKKTIAPTPTQISEAANHDAAEGKTSNGTWKRLPSLAGVTAFKQAVLSKFKRTEVPDTDEASALSPSSAQASPSVSQPAVHTKTQNSTDPQEPRKWNILPTNALSQAKSALISRFKKSEQQATEDGEANKQTAPKTTESGSSSADASEKKRRLLPTGWSVGGIKSGLQARFAKKEQPADSQSKAKTSSPAAKPEATDEAKKSLWDRMKRKKQAETTTDITAKAPVPAADKPDSTNAEKKSGWGWPKRNKQTETTAEATAQAPAPKPAAAPKPAPVAEKPDSPDAEKKSGWGWPKRNKQSETTAEATSKSPAPKPAATPKPAPVAEKPDSADAGKKSGWGWPKRNKQIETTAEATAKAPESKPAAPQEKEPRKSLFSAGSSWMKSKSSEGETLRADPPVESSKKVPTPHVAPANTPKNHPEPVKPVVQVAAQPAVQAVAQTAVPEMDYEVAAAPPPDDSYDDRDKRSKDKRAKQKNRHSQDEFGAQDDNYGEDDDYGNSRNQGGGGRNKNKKQKKKQRYDEDE